mmetsp:Transcript_21753/g.31186  ORF Transcript_21753/g.31186 Transcript_21753/m.31186 type:complete len:352 (-) Transcript_21753:152-1207(-)
MLVFRVALILVGCSHSNKVLTAAFSLPPQISSSVEQFQKGLSTILPTSIIPPPTKKKGTLATLDIVPSEPKRFGVAADQVYDILTSAFPGVTRLGSGAFAEGYKSSIVPKDDTKYTVFTIGNYQIEESSSIELSSSSRRYKPVEIYEFEGCPFCKKVREAVTILCLDVQFKPCPMNGPTFRKQVKEKYGSAARFPFMRDPNTGIEMFESDDIVAYLFRVYGTDGVVPRILRPGAATTLSASLGLIPRLGAGSSYKPSKQPKKPLVLWAYEASPFCKIVKECLCELEIPHIQKSCPRGSANRQLLFEKTGRFQAPYLEDPNTEDNVALFESKTIIEYLRKQYGIQPSPVKYL